MALKPLQKVRGFAVTFVDVFKASRDSPDTQNRPHKSPVREPSSTQDTSCMETMPYTDEVVVTPSPRPRAVAVATSVCKDYAEVKGDTAVSHLIFASKVGHCKIYMEWEQFPQLSTARSDDDCFMCYIF